MQFVRVLGIDHAQHRLGLRQVEAAGQEGPQRELARLGQASTLFAQRLQRGVQQGWRTDQVQFGRGLTCVAARPRPQVHVTRQRADRRGQLQLARSASRPTQLGQSRRVGRVKTSAEAPDRVGPADANHPPHRSTWR